MYGIIRKIGRPRNVNSVFRVAFCRTITKTKNPDTSKAEIRKSTTSVESEQNPELPDYNTSVDIDSHRLSRPVAKPRKPDHSKRWIGLHDLSQRTKGSLIPRTLKEMEDDEEFKLTAKKLKEMGQKEMTKQERIKRQRALDNLGIPDFLEFWRNKVVEKTGVAPNPDPFVRVPTEQLQINIGLYCNQACSHCHVESSPKRQEMMNHETAVKCMEILENSPSVQILDLTGGAPELNSEFRYLAAKGKELGRDVIVRSNLTSLMEPGQEDTAQFFADQQLHVVASLPCYTAKNVNMQRGKGVFDKSIQALITLNSLGFGKSDELQLDLVYNPLGAYLPPPQTPLAEKYKEELMEHFGIEFNKLFTMTNMPIKRFVDFLYRRNELQDYMELLVRNYNLKTIDRLMCRNLININWNGAIFDCDFNQQLDLPCKRGNAPLTVWDIKSLDDMRDVEIRNHNHCFGCTAGMGSS